MKRTLFFGLFVCVVALVLAPMGLDGQTYPVWKVGGVYKVGNFVTYQSGLYKCLQAHTAYAPNWTPPNTPALWKYISEVVVPRMPFPVHKSGPEIIPGVSVTKMNQDVKAFYEYWKTTYVQSKGDGKFIIKAPADPPVSSGTQSEAMGYGMIIAVLMADKPLFDGLWKMCDENRSCESNLFDWSVGEGDDSATDGDLDITYGLALAAYQWSSQSPGQDYAELVRELVPEIVSNLICNGGAYTDDFRLNVGDWSQGTSSHGFGTRISDWMPEHLNLFRAYVSSNAIIKTRANIYTMAKHLQDTYSPNHGFLPDFAEGKNAKVKPVVGEWLEDENDGYFDYNACRFPMRFTAAYKHDYLGSLDAYTVLSKFVKGAEKVLGTSTDISKFKGGYKLDGTPTADWDEEKCFSAPLLAAASVVGSKLNTQANWNWLVNTATGDGGYFNDSVNMLSILLISDNWWEDFPE